MNIYTHKLEHKKVIYDIGSNNGDDISYYLKKADVVIAVEANPILANRIQNRFSCEIDEGRLYVENCVLTVEENSQDVLFYIHKSDHVLSQFPKPCKETSENYTELLLPSTSILCLLKKYGEPFYIKIDIEGYDQKILKSLFENGIFPPFVSAESHSIEIFSLMVALGRYNSFKLVDGSTVSAKYNSHSIKVGNSFETYSFPHHSAGPFGDDITGEWMSADCFFKRLAFEGLGWKDIHATNQVNYTKQVKEPNIKDYFLILTRQLLTTKYQSIQRALSSILGGTIR